MKLSENTLTVLKNFASINSGVVLGAGKVQKTIAPDKAVLVQATIDDDLPVEFGIYDLNQFLGNITTLQSPELTFTSEHVTIDDGEFALRYHKCPSNLIITPPNKDLILKTVDCTFNLSNSVLQKLLKVATMNGLTNLSIVGKDGELTIKIHDKSSDTSNYGSVKIGDYAGKDFTAIFKTDNLKLVPGDYVVELQIGAFANFINASGNLKYFVAMETK